MSLTEQVWIVDDDSSIRWVMEKALTRAGVACRAFETGTDVLEALSVEEPIVVVSDIRMPGMDGIELLSQIRAQQPDLPVIITTAHSDLDSAVNAYEEGAFEYLPKPFDIEEMVSTVTRAQSQRSQRSLPAQDQGEKKTTEIIGNAPAMQEVFRAIGRLAQSHITVLINGESGTGKELVARALHRHSPRA
ncbi:MAG: response regulator, partial [Gammaproteobacteria bacterium]|nr:response regulator [Gammaproteobacteria bacterium]